SRRTAGLNGLRTSRASSREDAPPGASAAAESVESRDGATGSRDGAMGSPDGAAGSRGDTDSLPRLTRASTSSGFTSAFTGLRTSIKVPSAGAGISTVTLSVSSSTRGSSLTTVSPTALHHRNTVARVPSALGGTNTSASWVMLDFSQGGDCPRNRLGARQDLVEQHGAMGTG